MPSETAAWSSTNRRNPNVKTNAGRMGRELSWSARIGLAPPQTLPTSGPSLLVAPRCCRPALLGRTGVKPRAILEAPHTLVAMNCPAPT